MFDASRPTPRDHLAPGALSEEVKPQDYDDNIHIYLESKVRI
jgi:hypothetical protein